MKQYKDVIKNWDLYVDWFVHGSDDFGDLRGFSEQELGLLNQRLSISVMEYPDDHPVLGMNMTQWTRDTSVNGFKWYFVYTSDFGEIGKVRSYKGRFGTDKEIQPHLIFEDEVALRHDSLKSRFIGIIDLNSIVENDVPMKWLFDGDSGFAIQCASANAEAVILTVKELLHKDMDYRINYIKYFNALINYTWDIHRINIYHNKIQVFSCRDFQNI